MKNNKLIGLFGGTFDPVHNGHLKISSWIKTNLNLEKIIFIPASIPPHKLDTVVATPQQRYNMVELAIKNFPFFEVSNIELQRKGISYTIDTVNYFLEKWNLTKDELFLLIGADSLVEFTSWKNPKQILDSCQVAVFQRPNITLNTVDPAIKNQIIILDSPLINISSTNVRENVKSGEAIDDLVPLNVKDFIFENGLYT